MKDIDPLTLRLFVTVVEERSIARAAVRMNIAASAISKRIGDLEIELDTALLIRRAKGVEPTAAGETLFHHAQSLFAIQERLRGEMSEFARGVRGHVRISANTSSIVQFLPQELAAFLAACPGIRVQLHEETSRETIRQVQSGVADLGIVAASVPAGPLETIAYRQDRICVLARRDHALAGRAEVAFEETLGFEQVGLQEGSSLQAQVLQAAADLGRELRLTIRVASFDALRHMVQSGLGIGFLPEACILPYGDAMGLGAVRLTDRWAFRSLSICTRHAESLPVAAQLLLRHLTQGPQQPPLNPA